MWNINLNTKILICKYELILSLNNLIDTKFEYIIDIK